MGDYLPRLRHRFELNDIFIAQMSSASANKPPCSHSKGLTKLTNAFLPRPNIIALGEIFQGAWEWIEAEIQRARLLVRTYINLF